ncbi:hypothetical protein SAMN04488587_0596 [Methanococcoides vulcani]|uniref:Uncharacterized protein n=1 Tax=Methanococcoides vulcani TaxID=1353158 RepID=A0A1H9YIP5_9EURY|nr:hypothetical protein [Methanococcoides vulcani]SES68909.1 hypothetical protein SAMN04488587_0596 [Methanococcoides vulcani]
MKPILLALVLVLLTLPLSTAQDVGFAPEEMFSFSVQVPYGAKEGGLAVQGSNLSAYLFVESFQHGDMDVRVHLDLPDEFEVKDETVQMFRLHTEYDDWYRFIDFHVPPDVPCGIYTINTTAYIDFGDQHEIIERKTTLRVASKNEISDMISIVSVVIPSDEDGVGDPSRPENSIILQEASPFINKIKKIAGMGDSNEDVRVSYVGVEIENNGDEAVPLIVSYEILDIKTMQEIGEFKPTLMGMSSKTFSYSNIILPARSSKVVGLPIYTTDSVMGGEYLLRARVTVTGSNWDAATSDNKITAISRNWTSVVVSLVAFFLSITTIGIFVSRSNEIMNSFKTRHLVMISLFGTASFAAVNIPMTFLWEISHAVFGPFSFLFTGIFYEVILYMLIVAAVVLIPKPGVVFLLLMVRYLLNGIVLGHFNPVFLLSYSVNAIILEIMLYAAGTTRGNMDKLKTGLACGVADAISQYVSFSLWMVLYRLFYSDWYLKANILIDGFIYTFIGAWLGIKLGSKLKKVVE